ncbi:hypothetical protein [Zavarzinia sp.]|uniref:hypothetical protein n=1 Tax=Zavarzinia sp. TaxID=2027920 RepID=UPI003BB6BD4D|nr:hypothetical protein [Zavarzinia sp.]
MDLQDTGKGGDSPLAKTKHQAAQLALFRNTQLPDRAMTFAALREISPRCILSVGKESPA